MTNYLKSEKNEDNDLVGIDVSMYLKAIVVIFNSLSKIQCQRLYDKAFMGFIAVLREQFKISKELKYSQKQGTNFMYHLFVH